MEFINIMGHEKQNIIPGWLFDLCINNDWISVFSSDMRNSFVRTIQSFDNSFVS